MLLTERKKLFMNYEGVNTQTHKHTHTAHTVYTSVCIYTHIYILVYIYLYISVYNVHIVLLYS